MQKLGVKGRASAVVELLKLNEISLQACYKLACLFISFNMLRRKAFNRIFISTLIFFVILILYSVEKTSSVNHEKSIEANNTYIYTLNKDNYVSKTSIYVNGNLSTEEKIKEKLESMVKENNNNILLPSYVNPILPENTKVLKVELDGSIVKVYFSKELLNISEEQSEKMIEAIIYTITDSSILGVEIYVDNNILKYVPKTNKKIKGALTRDFGINKTYQISSLNDIVKVVMNYSGQDGNNYYDIPITKYVNSDKEKLEIIVDEFNSVNNNNLVSFFDNITILGYEFKDKTLRIELNKKIDYKDSSNLIKSIFDNYDVNKIMIFYNNQKILEKNRKDVENY